MFFFFFCLRDRENYVVLSSEKIYAFSAVESLSSGLQVAKSVALSFFEDKAWHFDVCCSTKTDLWKAAGASRRTEDVNEEQTEEARLTLAYVVDT